ncbi:LuxR C-terminal-related transcriptional regulator [Paenibacillus tarimensis]
MLPTPLLGTKITVPAISSNHITRERLIRLFGRCMGYKLTTVIAPAGYGKSSLVSEWVSRNQVAAGWVSLDCTDNDPHRFFNYITAALDKACPGLESRMEPFRHLLGTLSLESWLTLLINEVDGLTENILLVIDDMHLITEPSIYSGFRFLLDFMPGNLHICVISRFDIPLSLSSLRGKGHLLQVHREDLQFTREEVRSFLEKSPPRGALTEQAAELYRKTEGWITGLLLEILSIEHIVPERNVTLSTYSRDRYSMDYLETEVFQPLPEETRRFLLETSILTQLNDSLCNAVTGRTGSKGLLRHLERQNLFLIPLDPDHCWYRYHHLFSDFLANLLSRTNPEKIPVLRQRAADWLEDRGEHHEAIRHALAVRNYEQAIRMMERQVSLCLNRGEIATLIGWMEEIPQDLLLDHPELCISLALALLFVDKVDQAEALLENLEQMSDPDKLAGFSAHLYSVRSAICSLRKDTGKTIDYAQKVFKPSGSEGLFVESMINYNPHGESLLQGMFGTWGAINHTWEINRFTLESWKTERRNIYHYAQVALSECLFERNELDEAYRLAMNGIDGAEKDANPGVLVPGYLTLAKIKWAHGEKDAAFEYAEQCKEKIFRLNAKQYLSAIAAFTTRLRIRETDTEEVQRWADTCILPLDGNPDLSREYEHITLVRVLRFQNKPKVALRHLIRLQNAAERQGRLGSLIELAILQALMLHETGHVQKAFRMLARALTLAIPEGYIRIFIDEGTPMTVLLSNFMEELETPSYEGISRELRAYARLLLSLCQAGPARNLTQSPVLRETFFHPQLTRQENNVLRLMAQGLANKEIGNLLAISPETVKKHTAKVYKKLRVSSRIQAVVIYQEWYKLTYTEL